MMQNVEFKAELKDLSLARTICAALGASHIADLRQTDTYYRLPDARLKKRETEGEPTEWILYDRPNQVGNKLSTFHIYSEDEAAERFGARGAAWGGWGGAEHPRRPWIVVRKLRELWMYDDVRIHLDDVEGLGAFLEFEALISARRTRAQAEDAVFALRRELATALGEPIAASYADLLASVQETEV
jgi:adenylate cyclase, class 2